MIEIIIDFMATGWFKLLLVVVSTAIMVLALQKRIDEQVALTAVVFTVIGAFTNYFLNNPFSPVQTLGLLFLGMVILNIWDRFNEQI